MAVRYNRAGASSKAAQTPSPGLIKITWEDGTESHVTPQHAKDIRAQAQRMNVTASGHGRTE